MQLPLFAILMCVLTVGRDGGEAVEGWVHCER